MTPLPLQVGLVRRGYSASGGAEAYLRRFARGLAGAGHLPVLFTGEAWPPAQWPHRLVQVPGERSPRDFARALAERAPGECDFLLSLERVLRCDCYRAGDGVHAAWLRRRAGYEGWLQPWLRQWNPKHRQILALEEAMFGKGTARLVIANSRLVQEEIVRHYGYPAERIRVIYNGVPAPPEPEAAARLRAETRAELGVAPAHPVILFVGSGWERKGLRFALEAMERAALPQATLLVAGRGRRRGLPACAGARFLGPVADLPRWLAAADVFILPTLYDPFSNATLEAWAAGLPVITTAANGAAEVLGPEDGSVVAEPHAVEALAGALQLWAGAGAEGRTARQARAAGFTVERNVAESLAFLAEHLPPGAGGASP